ncbi:heavy-metal-associated domain-containing protein [Paracoccus tegillarcae]|uniref:Copper chaperone n=1 Tax=Paracoccus tegillarcae TaxID=1529068 RepID=A0A2K9EVW7_9RHOB|nr:heavy-metal-associated domain-containing protein [Paracoccus tegillarcae]AUH35056.1 copper chaperone [Paracoccus tegillarcae]
MKFTVPDMSCGHCKTAIEEAVAEAGGTAQVDLQQKSVEVDGIGATQAEAAIRGAGYAPEPA